ncbi:hypothetical protein FB45DRAFT_1011103 [Roridomyces roridus]|uniref:Uncharacterized protein n=1 Tax=Roridomyces roridus TaxID=1738132 RepID=A0AAD7B2X7_9AGAR|nr:hypothetical protein FB45DRAFT_1011103 [Roridomyces roridus]
MARSSNVFVRPSPPPTSHAHVRYSSARSLMPSLLLSLYSSPVQLPFESHARLQKLHPRLHLSQLPLLIKGEAPVDITRLTIQFALDEHPEDELAPYFKGYLGESGSSFAVNGVMQLGGVFLLQGESSGHLAPKTKRRIRHSHPYPQAQLQEPRSNSNYLEMDDVYPHAAARAGRRSLPGPSRSAVAGPSRGLPAGPSRAPTAGPSRAAIRAPNAAEKGLQLLLEGKGVEEDVWDAAMEKCDKCRRFFIAGYPFKKHTMGCLGVIEID